RKTTMLNGHMKTLAAGVPAALLALSAPAHATNYNFTIGVAANFATALGDIVDAFDAYYFANGGNTYNIRLVIDSTGNLKTCITAPSTATTYSTVCPNGHYDLLLAADSATPVGLQTSFGMIVPPSTTPQPAFFYATGSLVLYGQHTDISAGLPTTFTVPFVI